MARSWDRLDPRRNVRLQEELLREMVSRFVYPFSPFYRRLFDEHGIKPQHIRRLRDLSRIPLVSREDFASAAEDRWRPFRALLQPDERTLKRSAHPRLIRQVAKEKLLRGDDAAERVLAEEFKPVHLHVPGTDGGPVVGYTIRDLSGLAQASARAMAVMGARRSDVVVSTLPYGPALPFWHGYYGAMGAGMAGLHLGAGEVVRPAEAAAWMERVGMSVLLSQPAYAEGILRGAPPSTFSRLGVLALWTTGGDLQGARERFALRLQTGGASEAAVTTVLGIPEARVAWAECPSPPGRPEASTGYHTYPDLELLEVVDADGRSLGENEPGELVYTSLDWRGSALLRYRTGVLARRGITWEPCPHCGRSVARILPDLSRVDWRARLRGPRGPATVDLADVVAVLWRATRIALWELDVVKGAGEDGSDRAHAYVAGAPGDVDEVGRKLAPYGVRSRSVPFAEFARRLGVGLERPEVRVRIRSDPSSVR